MTKLYLITGLGEKNTDQNYKDFITSLEGKYVVIPVDLGLDNSPYTFGENGSFGEMLAKARAQIVDNTPDDVIMGFSIGALITYQLATEIKFSKAIICSICSILDGDLDFYPAEEVKKIFTDKQIRDLLSSQYGRPLGLTTLLYGANETKEVIARSKKLAKQFEVLLVEISGAGHNFSGQYLQSVKNLLIQAST
ncbi:MAG: hypothetical protein AAB468_02895 [Patescibacteria group bacterium]